MPKPHPVEFGPDVVAVALRREPPVASDGEGFGNITCLLA